MKIVIIDLKNTIMLSFFFLRKLLGLFHDKPFSALKGGKQTYKEPKRKLKQYDISKVSNLKGLTLRLFW